MFDWKNLENPYHDGVPVIVAKRDGTVGGAKGRFGLELVVGDRTIPGAQSGDPMVHPDHRGRGSPGR